MSIVETGEQSLNPTDGHAPTARGLRLLRRRQNDEVCDELRNLNQLIKDKGSRTLVKYLMDSTKKLCEDLMSSNNQLIEVPDDRKMLPEIRWVPSIEEDVFQALQRAV